MNCGTPLPQGLSNTELQIRKLVVGKITEELLGYTWDSDLLPLVCNPLSSPP